MDSLAIKVLFVVFPVFFTIGLGFAFARFKRIDLGPIIEVLIYLTVPALVISSLTSRSFNALDLATIAIAAIAVVLGTGVLTYIYLAITGRRALRGFYLPTMFMNSGNMSFPLALLAFGPDGLSVAVLYYITISILVYSLGIYIAKGRSGGLTEMFKLPLLYSAIIGVGITLIGLKLPAPIKSTVDMLGAATIPLMQLGLGMRLCSARLYSHSVSVAGSVIRILGGLILAYAAVELMGIDGLNRKIILLSSAMPSAVVSFIVSHRYNLDSDLVASTVAASTLLSIVTTPLLLMWLMW